MIILLTDGANRNGPDPVDAAKTAAEKGVRVFTIGVGSKPGTFVGGGGGGGGILVAAVAASAAAASGAALRAIWMRPPCKRCQIRRAESISTPKTRRT